MVDIILLKFAVVEVQITENCSNCSRMLSFNMVMLTHMAVDSTGKTLVDEMCT